MSEEAIATQRSADSKRQKTEHRQSEAAGALNEWSGFSPGRWQQTIDVRDFIQCNVTPYDGDEIVPGDWIYGARSLLAPLDWPVGRIPGPAGDSAWPNFYIDPNTCIDRGACVPECPADAIFPEPEVPPGYAAEIDTNRQFFETDPGYWAFDLETERIPISTK